MRAVASWREYKAGKATTHEMKLGSVRLEVIEEFDGRISACIMWPHAEGGRHWLHLTYATVDDAKMGLIYYLAGHCREVLDVVPEAIAVSTPSIAGGLLAKFTAKAAHMDLQSFVPVLIKEIEAGRKRNDAEGLVEEIEAADRYDKVRAETDEALRLLVES